MGEQEEVKQEKVKQEEVEQVESFKNQEQKKYIKGESRHGKKLGS